MKLIWLVLSVFVVSVFSEMTVTQVVKTTTQNETHTDYYKDETLTITCSVTGYTGIKRVLVYEGVTGSSSGCRINSDLGRWTADNNLDGAPLYFSAILSEYCTDDFPSNPAVELNAIVTNEFNNREFFCLAEDSTNTSRSSTETVDEIKEKPTNLQFKLTTGGSNSFIVFEDREFTFTCTSADAVPTSQYDYKIFRGIADSGTLITSTNTYTPTMDDREGITLQCTDTVHPLWKVQSDIIKTTELRKPHWIDPDAECDDLIRNPDDTVKITCNIDGNPVPTYEWSCDNCRENRTSQDGKILTLKPDETFRNASRVTCTAKVQDVGSSIQTCLVIWDITASIAPTTVPTATTTKKRKLSHGAIAGIVIGSVVVIALIVGLIIYFCRKDSGENPTANGKKPKEQGDVESVPMNKPGDKTDSKIPGKPKHQNSSKRPKTKTKQPEPANAQPKPATYSDEPIIYAELDHSHKPSGKAAKPAAKQAPAPPVATDAVEYTSIDLLKTQRANQQANGNNPNTTNNGNHDQHQTYENLGDSSNSPQAPRNKPPPPPQAHYANI